MNNIELELLNKIAELEDKIIKLNNTISELDAYRANPEYQNEWGGGIGSGGGLSKPYFY